MAPERKGRRSERSVTTIIATGKTPGQIDFGSSPMSALMKRTRASLPLHTRDKHARSFGKSAG